MAASVLAELAEALAAGSVTVVDLAQPLEPSTPVISLPPPFGQSAPFSIERISAYDDAGPGWAWSNIALGEHTGTHFDAPVHWVTGKDLTPSLIEAWESEHGQIEPGSWVLLQSGWSKRSDPARFLNANESGPHTPGPSPEAVTFLVEKRDVIGFGTECVGTDAGQAFLFDPAFPCHAGMHGANKFGLASLNNLDRLPPKGAILITAPLKITGGTGSPCRVLALVPGS
jgi:kynurenine formamidase